MSIDSNFPSFESMSGFNNSPFGPYWEKEEQQKINFKTLNNSRFSTLLKKELNISKVDYFLALGVNRKQLEDKMFSNKGTTNFTVFILAKQGTIKNFSGITANATEYTSLKQENLIDILGVTLGYDLLAANVTKEQITNLVNDFDKWMHPNGFFTPDQLSFIKENAFEYYQKNTFSILDKPIENKILILLLNALKEDLRAYFNEDYIAKFIQQIALKFKENALITDRNRWNPYLSDGARNTKYDPFFIPNFGAEKVTVDATIREFEAVIANFTIQDIVFYYINANQPNNFNLLLKAVYKNLEESILEFYADAKDILQVFADAPEMCNAFLVGLYNGLIRFLASLIEMVGFFVSLANPGNWDNFIAGFKKFFSEFWDNIKKGIKAFLAKFTTAENYVDFIKIFVEEITGFVIELFLLYLSIGASGVKKIIDGLEKLLKNPKATLEDVIEYLKTNKSKKADDVGDEKPIDVVPDEIEKLKIARKMWDEFKYTDFFMKPPKKPCFLAGTMVKTEKGLKAIEKIEQGLKILTYNFENQKTEHQTVLQTFSNYAEQYIEIHTETEQLNVTGAHLFYIPNDKKWIAASQLKLDMQLIDAQQNLVVIKKLEIIKEKVPTYNLEVAQNHNYYVGEHQSILTHNDSKKLKFTSEIFYEFEFYEYVDYSNKPTYVGQTTQSLTKRADQHAQDYKKYATKKEFVGLSKKLPQEIIVNGKPGPYKMTPFEAAITEMHELSFRGGKRNGVLGLFNKKNPVSESSFERIKRDFPKFNPCRFYV